MHVDKQTSDFDHNSPYIDVAVEIFRVVADATRIRIVLALKDGELSVNELAETVDRSSAAVSQHLAKLRWSKIVRVRQDGTRMLYRLADEHVIRLVTEGLRQAEHAIDDVPGHHA